MNRYCMAGLLLLASLMGWSQNQNFDTVKIVVQKLSDHIYMLKGSGGNMGVLTGPEGTLLIDDQFAPLSEKIKAAIKSFNGGEEVKYLVNTHLHGDHSGGNENFRKTGATIVAQENVRDRMTRESMNRTFKRVTPPRDKDALPIFTFSKKMNIHLNGEELELIHFDPAHTDGDIIVHFKKANIFHTGDLFVRYGFPYIDLDNGGGINGFITSLDQLLPMLDDASRIIPGHGELATKADVIVFRNMLADLRDKVAAALKKGTPTTDLAALGITEKYEAVWGKGFMKGKDYVVMIAESLK